MTNASEDHEGTVSIGGRTVVCYGEIFVDFDFFSAIFISSIIMEIRNAPHRRLEINGGLWTGRTWTNPISSPHTSWKFPLQAKCLRVSRTVCQVKEPDQLLIAIAFSVLTVMVTMPSRLNLNFRKISSNVTCLDKADRGRGGKKTSGNGQAWSSPSPRGQWRTGKNGGNRLRNHLWCPNDPRG